MELPACGRLMVRTRALPRRSCVTISTKGLRREPAIHLRFGKVYKQATAEIRRVDETDQRAAAAGSALKIDHAPTVIRQFGQQRVNIPRRKGHVCQTRPPPGQKRARTGPGAVFEGPGRALPGPRRSLGGRATRRAWRNLDRGGPEPCRTL